MHHDLPAHRKIPRGVHFSFFYCNDVAMSKAKKAGSDQVNVWEGQLNVKVQQNSPRHSHRKITFYGQKRYSKKCHISSHLQTSNKKKTSSNDRYSA